jgi:hypothetical protein
MKKNSVVLFFLMSAFVTGFSQTQSSKQAEDTTSYTDREIAEDEIREFGRISKFEDVGYPMYSVTVEFPERLIWCSNNYVSSGI